MHISQQQFALLHEAAALRRLENIRRFLRQHYPEQVASVSDEEMLGRIERGLAKMAERGVKDVRAAALFVVMQFAVGPTFFQHPACRAILSDRRLPPEQRVFALFHGNANIPWSQIAAQRDDSAWDAVQRGGPA